MNSFMQQNAYMLTCLQELRPDLMSILTDADLAYKLPGRNGTLGELLLEMGEVEQSYIDSFKNFRLDFSYHHPDKTVLTSVIKLKAWFDSLDQELQAVLEGLSEDDFQKTIDRINEFSAPISTNFHIYREALFIFYGKADLFIKALEKRVPGKWSAWIGDRADCEAVE